MEANGLKSARIAIVSFGLVFLLAFAPHAFALSNGQAANLVIGQPNFTSNIGAVTSTLENAPNSVAFDGSGNLWVADLNNNRVLEYKAPFSTSEAASLVIGQTSLTGIVTGTTSTELNNPSGLAFDSSGNLWVVDMLNSRVLEFKAPFSTGEAASLVIGQGSFTASNYSPTNSTNLSYATGLAFDASGNLWVADQGNDRVLEYKAPFTMHEAAALVIGQAGFAGSNFATTATGLNGVNTLAFDHSGNLWVVDYRQSRVLEYTTPFSTHEAATVAIGQTSFSSRECAFTSTCAANSTNLFNPNGIGFDSAGNMWVVDSGNNRVLEYSAPFSTHEAASLVIGQSSLTGEVADTTQSGLAGPVGLAFDSGSHLWIADAGNSRVLEYGGTTTTPEFPSIAVPIVFTAVLAAAMLLRAPARRFRQP